MRYRSGSLKEAKLLNAKMARLRRHESAFEVIYSNSWWQR